MDTTSAPVRISAIVCTWNNARSLEATLHSLAEQKVSPGVGYEVLVLDNNSTDDTAAVAKQFTARPGSVFRYVFEKAQGLSLARNRGTAEARGEIVAFIDDDAIADPDWLAQLWATYERQPGAACVGGKVELRLPSVLPSWYSGRLEGYLSARDLPYGEAKTAKDFPFGTNISFRRRVLHEVGGFHPLLGAQQLGRVKLQGDETQLCLRVMKLGKPILFQPAARVVHVVPEQRLRREYFLGLAQANGYVQVMLDNDGEIGRSTLGQLKRYARRWVRRWWEHQREARTLSPSDRFWSEVMVRSAWGAVWYCVVAKRQLQRLAQRLNAGGTD